MQKHSTECDGRFHSHMKRTLPDVPTTMAGLEQVVCMRVCVFMCMCACTSAKESELCISILEMVGRVATYVVSHLIDRSIIWYVALKVFFECTEENQSKRDKDRVWMSVNEVPSILYWEPQKPVWQNKLYPNDWETEPISEVIIK
jgi:hypothetical protein